MKKINILISLIIVLTLKVSAQYQFPNYIQDSIRIEMHWNCDSIRIGCIKVYDPCPYGSTIWSPIDSFGHATLTIKGVLPGSYEIWYRILLDSSQVADLSYYVYYNEVLKDEGSYRLIGPAHGEIAQYFSHISTPYANDFDVRGESSPLCFSFNRTVGIAASNSCNSEGVWIRDGQTVSYEIVTETDYVSFYNGNNEIGSSYSASYPQGSSIGIRQKKLCTDTVDRYADISITWGNITKHTSVLINRLAPAVNFYTNDDNIRSGDSTYGVISLDNPEAYRQRIVAPGICNYNVSENATYKVEILSGGQYISLIDPTQNGKYKTIDALAQQDGNAEFQIIADGTAPLQPVTATIRVSSSDANIKDSIRTLVINPPLIRAIVDPPMIGVGDTARITMQYLNASGGYDNFPDDQQYEVGMAEGCVWGDIVAKPSGGEFTKNNYFASVVKPIMFVAADSLEDDGGTVKLDIGIVETLNAKVKHKTVDTSWQRIKAELDKFYTAKRGSKVKHTQTSPCNNQNLDSEEKTQATVQADNSIEILYPNIDSKDEPITSEPKMPTVVCRARLKNYDGGTVKFRWAYWLTASLEREKRNCPRFSKSYFKGYSYAENTNTTFWTVPFMKDSAYFWFESVSERDYSVSDLQGKYYNKGYGCGNHTTVYEGGDGVFTGGKIWVKVTAFDVNGNQIGCGCLDHGELIGDNPLPEQVKQYVNLRPNWQEFYAIVLCESTGNQFEVSQKSTYPPHKIGWPRYGAPNGYGLMQLDSYPAPTEEQVWNWKSNVDGGITKYLDGRERADKYFRGKHIPHTTDNDKGNQINRFQLYNSGTRMKFLWNGKKWYPNPDLKEKIHYGENVYKTYLQVLQQNYREQR
jgi:hypothetical protein